MQTALGTSILAFCLFLSFPVAYAHIFVGKTKVKKIEKYTLYAPEPAAPTYDLPTYTKPASEPKKEIKFLPPSNGCMNTYHATGMPPDESTYSIPKKRELIGINPADTIPFMCVDIQQQAHFQEGQEAMAKWLKANIKLPRKVRKGKIEGKVYVRFAITKEGKIVSDSASIMKAKFNKPCPECEKEALRLVRSMPDWKPAEMHGNPVNVYFSLPIVFRAND